MKIVQSLNQNALLVDVDGREEIVVGKGIGFNKRKGDSVDTKRISKRYQMIPGSESSFDYYSELSEKVIQIAEEVAEIAEPLLNKRLTGNFILSLASHIQFCEEKYRTEDLMEIPAPFNYELKYLYPKEYAAANLAVNYLADSYKILLPSAEISFFTLHFVNGLAESEGLTNVVELSEMMNDTIAVIENKSGKKLDPETIEFSRFIVHFRYFIIRNLSFSKNRQDNREEELDEVFNLSFETFPNEKAIVDAIKEMLDQEHGLHFGKAEDFYLLLHIVRILKN